MRKCIQLLLLAVSLALLGGCQYAQLRTWNHMFAGMQPSQDKQQDVEDFEDFEEFEDPEEADDDTDAPVFDPLSGYNRIMFYFNDKLFLWIWQPLAKGYRFVVPEVARIGINRAYKNLGTPVRFVNSLFQLKFQKAGLELGRLLVNTTIGIGGLFDPADAWFDWRAPSAEDFGQTLGSYGVGAGFPLVLPFLGQSNARDGIGRIADGFTNPRVYLLPLATNAAITAGEIFNYTSLHIGEYESLKEDALDPYTFFRDAYQQHREKKIQE